MADVEQGCGPTETVVVDRRARPWVGGPRERRIAERPVWEDRRIAERNRREGHLDPAWARVFRG